MATKLSDVEEKIYVYAKLLNATHKNLHKVASRLSNEKKANDLKQQINQQLPSKSTTP